MKLLSLNVFAGSPVPVYRGATRSLFLDGDRLERLAQAVEREEATIVCLQELYCRASRRFLQDRWRASYRMLPEGLVTNPFGPALNGALQLVLACAVSWCLTWFLPPLASIVVAGCLVGAAWRDTALDAFLGGDDTGLVIFYRPDQVTVTGFTTVILQHQRGDITNWFGRRAYQHLTFVCEGRRVNLVHVHLSALGPSSDRRCQTLELPLGPHVDFIIGDFNDTPTSEALQPVIDAGFTLASPHHDTWSALNPLTRGQFPVSPNGCIDHIWSRHPGHNAHLVANSPPFVSDHFGVVVETER